MGGILVIGTLKNEMDEPAVLDRSRGVELAAARNLRPRWQDHRDQVDFTESYRGSADQRWTVWGHVIGIDERRRHTVHYSGRVDRENGCIVGGWTIRMPGLLGRFLPPLSRGTFELYQKS